MLKKLDFSTMSANLINSALTFIYGKIMSSQGKYTAINLYLFGLHRSREHAYPLPYIYLFQC